MPKVPAAIKTIAPGLDSVQAAFKEKITQNSDIYTSPEQLETYLDHYELALASLIEDATAAIMPHIGWLRWRDVLLAFKTYTTQHMTSIPMQLFTTHLPHGYQHLVTTDVTLPFSIRMLHSFSINYLTDFDIPHTAGSEEPSRYVTPDLVTKVEFNSTAYLAIQHPTLQEVINKYAVKQAIKKILLEWITQHIVTFANNYTPTIRAIDYINDIFIGEYDLDNDKPRNGIAPNFAFKPIKYTKTP